MTEQRNQMGCTTSRWAYGAVLVFVAVVSIVVWEALVHSPQRADAQVGGVKDPSRTVFGDSGGTRKELLANQGETVSQLKTLNAKQDATNKKLDALLSYLKSGQLKVSTRPVAKTSSNTIIRRKQGDGTSPK